MSKNPAAIFYWNDWESDAELRLCSFAAQGLWMRLLCIAAKADPVGFIVQRKKTIPISELARMVGGTPKEVSKLVEELLDRGVCSRDRRGRMYSRRLVRDFNMRNIHALHGRLGGNPALLGKSSKRLKKVRGVNPPVNPPLNPRHKGGVAPHTHSTTIPLNHYTTEPPPTTSNEPPSEIEQMAVMVVGDFLDLRLQHWSETSRLPSPETTLQEQAKAYLSAGATPELCKSIMDRVMRANAASGEGPPTNLRFCHRSVESEIAKRRRSDPSTGNGAATKQNWRWQRALRRWNELPGEIRDKTPMPVEADYPMESA